MFYSDGMLQYRVRVERPNPVFARALQQAIGGVEGEIRVMLQYLFQAWGSRGPKKYRDMLLNTGTEEIGHVEMLSTAVALNLEGAPLSFQEQVSNDPVAGAVLNGMNLRHILSAGWRRRRRTPTACRSTAATSTPAATSPPTCTATCAPRRRGGRWRCGSTT
jgi:Mn-containing catalase